MLGSTITERWRGLRMKARLEFDLPEEREEFEINRKAVDLYVNLSDMTEQVRRWRKHGHRFKDVDELLDALWEDCINHELLDI